MMAGTCTVMLDDGTDCRGKLSPWTKGRLSGRWFRTCARCFTTQSQAATPEGYDERGPIAWQLPHDLPLTWQERLERAREQE